MNAPASPEPRTWRAPLAVLLIGVAVLLGLDVLLRHGWTVAWYAVHEGRRVELARGVEHRLAFHNDRRPYARMMAAWDFRRLGMPASSPPIDATLSAQIAVPGGGRRLLVEAEGETRLRVDGEPLGPDALVSAGTHDLEIDWRCELERGPRFVLRWIDGPRGAIEDVPRSALTPGEGPWPCTRLVLWLLGLAGVLSVAALVSLAVRDGGRHRRMSLRTLAVLGLVALTLGLRGYDHDLSPDPRENEDELFAMWNGHSLLTQGVSRGWTLWPHAYSERGPEVGVITLEHYVYRPFHVVSPYFEHPPLLHLLVGAAGWLGGAEDHLEMKHTHGRLVPLAASVLVVVLIVAVGRRLDRGSPAPYFAALLWAALPWIALQSRTIKEEVLVTPLALGMVLAFLQFRDQPDRANDPGSPAARRWLVLAATLAGAAVLAKVTGFALSVALGVLVARVGRARDVGVVALGAALGAAMLLGYGAALGWQEFLFAQETQSGRQVTFNIFLRFFHNPQINHSVVGRGWLLFLWLAAMASFFARHRANTAVLVVPLFTYLGAIGFGAGAWSYGWYVTPILPFLCLAAGRFLADLWREPELGRGAVFVLTLVLYSLNFATSESHFFSPGTDIADARRLLLAVLVAFLAPFGLAQAFGWRAPARAALLGGLLTMVVVSFAFVGGYDVEPHRDFDRNRGFNL
jgi:hypothetical protein